MTPFDYQAPADISEAVTLLARKDLRARPIAGGTDLLVQLRYGLLDLDLVVDIKQIPELNSIVLRPEGGVDIGAAVSCADLSERREVQEAYPALVDAVSVIGGTAIRNRATLGGNLCNAAPSGDSIPAMIILGATCTVAGPKGRRTVPVEGFCTGPGTTLLGEGEILVSIHLPPPKPHSGARYLRFIPRGEMDIAVVGAGVSVVLSDDQGHITDARIALGAVAPVPLPADAASASLIGRVPDEEAFEEASSLARETAHPITDVRGTEAFRRHLIGVLVRRALRDAVDRAKGELIDD